MTTGLDLSQVVKAAAVWVERRPPLGKLEPSVSPTNSLSGGKVACERGAIRRQIGLKCSLCKGGR